MTTSDRGQNHDADDSLAYCLALSQSIRPRTAFPLYDPGAIEGWQLRARAKLRELLGLWDEPALPLDPKWEEPVDQDRFTRQAVWFQTAPGLRAFGYLLVPIEPGEPGPAVVCLPGHGAGVCEIVGLDSAGLPRAIGQGYQRDFALQCVERGLVVLALEMLGFGRRRDPAARARGPESSSCQPAAGAALLLGQTMAAWRVRDTMRALDLLASRPEVDPDRLGLVGISGGGTVGLYTAALDTRVAATLLSCSFCTFRDSILGLSHCIDNYVPGILTWFEMADLAGLILPRRLFIESGLGDPLFPREGVRRAVERARAIFQAAGRSESLDHAAGDHEHVFDGRAGLERLTTWLRP